MAERYDQEKTESPTPKKKRDAREKGQVAKSVEVSSVAVLGVSLLTLSLSGAWMLRKLIDLIRWFFQNAWAKSFPASDAYALFIESSGKMVLIMTPLLLSVFMAGLIANIFQVGLFFSGESLTPKWSRLDPIEGLKRIVSVRGLAEFLKTLLKLFAICLVVWLVLRNEAERIPALTGMAARDIFSFIGSTAFKICLYASITLLLLAGFDYAFQRWQHEKNLMMSPREVQEEFKQTEGDPKVKSRIRAIQIQMSRKRMMEAVPAADVVITNPTSFAVAVQYDPGEMKAPRISAKGKNRLADKIKSVAREHGVPVVENRPLARILYKTVEIGDLIPEDLYRAVAEVLAFVYRLKGMPKSGK